MKRLLMGFATCALIMASCTKQEIMETAEDGQGSLSFAAGVGKQSATRAAEFNNTALKAAATATSDGIVLNAYQNATTWGKWYTDAVVHDGTNWKLKTSVRFRNENPTKYITYFPKSDKLVEVTDAFANANFTTDKFPQFTYTVADNSAVQEDLIAGITEVDAKKTDITLGMRHILSQVNFGTVAYHGANIQIRNIEIVGVGNKATFTYKDKNAYPIGEWNDPTAKTSSYSYYSFTNQEDVTLLNQHQIVSDEAISGDKYIFGDGGNAGPGKGTATWYPTSETEGAWKNASTGITGIKNSLMLLPQELTETAKVTFEYQITDVSGIFVAGGPTATEWAEGEFSLNFKTNTADDKFYKGEWEQNYRYVYLIDFTDFLDGIALTFKVDVDMYPWENHDGDGGIIDIMAAGQPSAADMNDINFTDGNTWYIASQSEAAPDTYKPIKWAQVMRNETWDLSAYDFANIDATKAFTLNFKNVIFNTLAGIDTQITLTLPEGYSVSNGTGITMTGNYTLSLGDKSDKATITITNISNYNSPTTLGGAIDAIDVSGTTIYYKGATAVDLTEMDNANLSTIGDIITVKFTSPVTPTVGATANGVWTYTPATKTATWEKTTAP